MKGMGKDGSSVREKALCAGVGEGRGLSMIEVKGKKSL